jgi:hypothetical protein
MTYRQTFVVEYEKDTDAPGVNGKTECMGGKLVAVQFSDALEELSQIREAAQEVLDDELFTHLCDDEDCSWCKLQKAMGGDA